MNPTRTAQDVRVELVGLTIARTVRVAPRTRQAVELGDWSAVGEFGVEVACDSVCAAALVMWDRNYQRANTSVPLLGCEAR